MSTRAMQHVMGGLLLLGLVVTPVFAGWPTSMPLSVGVGKGTTTAMAPDGAGGVIVLRRDTDLFAVHILATGEVDPAWPSGGRLISSAVAAPSASYLTVPAIVTDGAGGAFVLWPIGTLQAPSIRVHHVLAQGQLDPAWPATGLAPDSTATGEVNAVLCADGLSGAFVSYTRANRVRVQHLLSTGIDPDLDFPRDGVPVASSIASVQDVSRMVSAAPGGVFVIWRENRTGTFKYFVQHLEVIWGISPFWSPQGYPLTASNLSAGTAAGLIPGAGGAAIAVWSDARVPGAGTVVAQRIAADGAMTWGADGLPIGSMSSVGHFAAAPDAAGGALVAVQGQVPPFTGFDTVVKHALSSGVLDPAWPNVDVVDASDNITDLGMASDDAGGSFLLWTPGAQLEPVAHHVNASGLVDAGWPSGGVRFPNVAGLQSIDPHVLPDGHGAVFVSWSSGYTPDNLRAHRLSAGGRLGNPEGALVRVADVPNDQGRRLVVQWDASDLEAAPYSLSPQYDVYFSTTGPPAAYQWTLYTTVDAAHLPGYGLVVPTLQDSGAAGPARVHFRVRTRVGSFAYESLVRAGSSRDNLAPPAPSQPSGVVEGGELALSWSPSDAADVAGYRVYRGAAASSATLIASTSATSLRVPLIAGDYRVTAFDAGGNESPAATWTYTGTLGVGEGSRRLALARPMPDPAQERSTLRFTLPSSGHVLLAVYDASGRRVRTLLEGTQEAGEHAPVWDLRDAAQQRVQPGLYFARLEVGDHSLTRRLVVLR